MKNNVKSNLLCFMAGGLLFGSIGVGAVTYFTADNVEFIPTDSNWKVTTVGEAMNSLYTVNNDFDDFKSSVVNTLTANNFSGNVNDESNQILSNLSSAFSSYNSTISGLNSDISNGKATIAAAITSKGVATTSADSFETMASNIKKTGVDSVTFSGSTSARAWSAYGSACGEFSETLHFPTMGYKYADASGSGISIGTGTNINISGISTISVSGSGSANQSGGPGSMNVGVSYSITLHN